MKHPVEQLQLRLLLACVMLQITEPVRITVSALNFTFDESSERFGCDTNLLCMSSTLTSSTGRELWLLPLPQGNDTDLTMNKLGTALYIHPVRLVDHPTMKSASFRTSFTFTIIPVLLLGDGFTFVVISSNVWNGAPGGCFGLYQDDCTRRPDGAEILAIEFDTYKNRKFPDEDETHVGLDLESATSVIWKRLPSEMVKNQTTHVWIDYHGSNHSIEVRISFTQDRPEKAILEYTVNLCSVFNATELLWIGFSAGSGVCTAAYKVSAWKFESFDSTLTMPPQTMPPVEPPMDHQSTSRNDVIILILIISVSIAMLVLVCTITGHVLRTRVRAHKTGEQDIKIRIPITFDYHQLSLATENFSDHAKLGEGGFGSVYRGFIPDCETLVAIKKLKDHSHQGEVEFMSEVSTITQIRHRNVVELLGWCKHGEELLLVYNLMPQGSLDKVLFYEDGPVLSWPQRRRIVSGLAAALEYLHEGWIKQVIHRDVKSSNVMLDRNFTAKLGDFGLAQTKDHQVTMSTTNGAGTHGYMAPEAALLGKYTAKSDVYAFGVVVLETVCGKRAVDFQRSANQSILVDWVWGCVRDGDLTRAVDRRLEGRYEESEARILLQLGLTCTNVDSDARPSMRQIIHFLSGDAPINLNVYRPNSLSQPQETLQMSI